MVLVALVVTVAATVAATFTQPRTVTALPTAGPSSVAPRVGATAARPALDIGIAYGDTLPFMSDKDLAAALDDAVEVGAKWVRADLSWEDIQPDSPSLYQWDRFDRVVKAARVRGLTVLAVLAYTPPFARSSVCATSPSCAPVDPAAFAAFATKAAARYTPKGVTSWEIWNEPNIDFWEPSPDPVAYTKLLRLTSKAIRQVAPRATLLMGGLAAVATDPKKHYISQSSFLTAVSKLGGNKLVDAISYHPYTYPYLPSAKTTFGTAFEKISSTTTNLVAILAKYGTPDLPVWITETGAPTNGPGLASDGVNIPVGTTHVTEGFQASIAADTVSAAAANPHVGAVFWYADRDSGTNRAQRSRFFGLRRLDGTPKPAFAALRLAVAAYERERTGQP